MRILLLGVLLCCESSHVAAQAPTTLNSTLVHAQAKASSPVVTTALPGPQTAKINPAKEAAIRKLFEVQGTKNVFDRAAAGMVEKARPQISAALPAGGYRERLVELFLARFKEKLDPTQMVNVAVPVYDKYFTTIEIGGLIQFYSTPLGKKAISVLPQVLTESQAAGMKLGERWGQEAMTEVLEEHPDLKKALEAASATTPNR